MQWANPLLLRWHRSVLLSSNGVWEDFWSFQEVYYNIFWKLNEVLLIQSLTKTINCKIFAEKWVLMRNIGWVITQVRLSKRFVCSIAYFGEGIKTFLFWWIISVCVCFSVQKIIFHITTVVMHLSEGKGEATVGVYSLYIIN